MADIGMGEIRLECICGFTSSFVRRVPDGMDRTRSVDVFTLSGPFGVETVIGLGSKLVVVIGRLT